MLGGGLPPVGLPRSPSVAEALEIGVPILADDGRHALGMRARDAKSSGRAIIEHVQRIPGEPHPFDEAVDHFGQIVECICEGAARWSLGVAKTGQIGIAAMKLAVGETLPPSAAAPDQPSELSR